MGGLKRINGVHQQEMWTIFRENRNWAPKQLEKKTQQPAYGEWFPDLDASAVQPPETRFSLDPHNRFLVCKKHPRNPGWLGRICSFWFMLNNILAHAALSVCRNTKPPVWNGKTTAGDLGSIPVNDESSHLHGCQTPILHNCSIHHGAKMLNMRFTQVLFVFR